MLMTVGVLSFGWGFCTYQKVLIKRGVVNAEESGRDQEFLGNEQNIPFCFTKPLRDQ